MTDIEGFVTIYGHSDNLLNNKDQYMLLFSVLTCDVVLVLDYASI